MTAPYPFSALVGSEDLQLALVLNAVNPAVGGVLVRGEKGTAKSTAVRGLAALLPDVTVVAGCAFACDPAAPDAACPSGPHPLPEPEVRAATLVELPVGASEDRLAGSLDLEQALAEGRRAFEPGLLARAHRGVLYVDEVNLLGDHLVDLLLDAAAMGTNIVERESVSVRHAARFQLVGTMNPEEGELRPQLLDRFGLTVEVAASRDPAQRAEVVRRRLDYESDPDGFAARWADADANVAARIRAARKLLGEVTLGETALQAVVAACTAFEVDGLRADIVTAKAANALAAWEGRTDVTVADVRAAALLALPHRRRRGPFESPGLDPDVLDEALAGLGEEEPDDDPPPGGDEGGSGDGAPPSGGHSGGPRGGQGGAPETGTGRSQPPRGEADAPSGHTDDAGGAPESDVRTDLAPEGEEPPEGRQGDRAPAEPTTLPVGATFDPALLRLTGAGAGAWGRRSPARSERGHHVGARVPDGRVRDVAFGATLRAAAARCATAAAARSATATVTAARAQAAPPIVGSRPPARVGRGDLREKVREGREGNLVLFLVDASGSMAARRRMSAVKGAVLSLLRDAYQRRDRVGLVTFRGEDAQLVVPPTTSVELAARLLETLPTGGRTPLAAGLERAAGVLAAEAVRDPRRRPLLVLLTDGRATAGVGEPVAAAERAAAGLASRGVPALVVDTEDAVVRLGLAGRLATAMGAPWLRLEDLAAGSLAGLVRGITAGGAPQRQRRAA